MGRHKGLSAQAETFFRTWAGEKIVGLGPGDETWKYLRSASLLAGLLGDHGAWRHTYSELARYLLSTADRSADEEGAASAMRGLCRAGDKTMVERATQRLVQNGPAGAARVVALTTDPDVSTRTSAHADLRLLIEAADLIPTERANELANWAMSTHREPEHYLERTGAHFLVHD